LNLTDTHCHLVSKNLAPHLEEIVAEAQAQGVTRILNVGYTAETSRLACEQSLSSKTLFAAVGIQPHDADVFSEETAIEIETLAKSHEKVVAIGEIGLDAFHKLSTMENQIRCYRHFLALAVSLNLPVIVHMRNTFEDVAGGIREYSAKNLRGVIHCFTGNIAEAKTFLDLGFHISFSGIVTFKTPSEFDDVVKYIPNDRILCETDSPYLAPKPHRGKTNHPAFVRHVAEHIATLRGQSLERFAEQTTENALALFSRMRNA
jgi:TatD DNase family protein